MSARLLQPSAITGSPFTAASIRRRVHSDGFRKMTNKGKERSQLIAVYPGSFDPIHNGQVQRAVGRLRGTNRRQGVDSFTARRDGFRLRSADGADEQTDEPERRNRLHVLQFLALDQGSRRIWQTLAGAGPGTRDRAAARQAQSRLSRAI